MHATGHSSLFCPPACAFPSRWPPAQPHLLCLLQRTRPFPCSRGCATGHWGLAPAPCLWPRGSPSRYAAAAAWAKHGAASVRNAPCLAQVTLCTSRLWPPKGFLQASGHFPHLDLTSSRETLVFLPARLFNQPGVPPSLLTQ